MSDNECYVVEFTRQARRLERVVVVGRQAVAQYTVKKLGKLTAEGKQNLSMFLENMPITDHLFKKQAPLGLDGVMIAGGRFLDWVSIYPAVKL